MDAKALIRIFEASHGSLTLNLEGITGEESLRAPEPGGNTLNWVLGHIVWSRSQAFNLLGLPPVWEPEKVARYARGSAAIGAADHPEPFEEIRAAFNGSQQPLVEALKSLSAEQLAASNEKGLSLAAQLGTLGFHEGYHGGQVALLRRLLGHEGAIK